MPYINRSDRHYFDERIKNIIIQSAGELNYIITMLIDTYIADHKKSYQTINEAIGVLECAKMELYRRIASPYENTKLEENGDVYTI